MRTTVRRGVTITEAEPHEGCAALVLGWTHGWGTGALRALVFMKGWEWFVVDTFGAQTLSFVQSWGLFMLVNFATYQLNAEHSKARPLIAMLANLITSLMWSGLAFVSLLILAGLR